MKIFFNKALSLLALLRYPHISKEYRYFIRDNYFSRMYQLKYWFKDYVKKKPYKTVSFCGEFQQELTFALPFAYWHYLNGTLQETISSKFTRELYFFSSLHKESYSSRNWETNFDYEIPNIAHNINFDYSKWKQVPLKKEYSNNVFVYDKPILIIANRYNIEWDNPPISYFDIPSLSLIIEALYDQYQIIYNRPAGQNITEDNSEIKDLNEKKWIKENYPKVLLMDDLYENNKHLVNSFNHLQLMVYANANRFVSIHGGTATLASYFGGINIIYSKQGREHYLNEFQTIFPKLSGAQILHAKSVAEVKEFLMEYY